MLTSTEPVLRVEDLRMYLHTRSGVIRAVDGVSFTVREGETLGIVGESGSGKSMTCLSVVRLVPQPAGRFHSGRILYRGEDLLDKSERYMTRRIRGGEIGMILQDHLMSLNPTYTVRNQIAESLRLHGRTGRRELRAGVIDALESVRIPAAAERLHDYPFQFSGGMRQRISAAMAMVREPSVLIADEPTTALDVTVQDQFLRLLKDMQREHGMALILVTHDLGVVAETCDRVAVMYAGRIVETGAVDDVFQHPQHPYTMALLEALPEVDEEKRLRLHQIDGGPPDLADLPAGCRFAARCPEAMDVCRSTYPPAFATGEGAYSHCWLLDEEHAPPGRRPGVPAPSSTDARRAEERR